MPLGYYDQSAPDPFGAAPAQPGQDPTQAPAPQAPAPSMADSLSGPGWQNHVQVFSKDQMQSMQSGDAGGGYSQLAGLKGQDFMDALQKLNPNIYERVKRIGEGRETYPTGISAKNPQNVLVMNLLGQAYPGFGQQDYKSRLDTIEAFSPKGKEGQRLAAANQAIQHANSAMDASKELGGFNILPSVLNPIRNLVEGEFSTDYQAKRAKYTQFVNAMGDELTTSFRGRGGGTQEEINTWRRGALAANAPAEREASIQAGMELLHGSLKNMAQEYDQGMRSATQSMDPRNFIYQMNRPIFDKLLGAHAGGTTSTGFYGDGGQPVPGQPQMNERQPSAAQAPAAPPPGNYVYVPGKGLVRQ